MPVPTTITVDGFTKITAVTPPGDSRGTYEATLVGDTAATTKSNGYRQRTEMAITTLQSGTAVDLGDTFVFGGKTWLVFKTKKSKESHNSSDPLTLQSSCVLTRPAV